MTRSAGSTATMRYAHPMPAFAIARPRRQKTHKTETPMRSNKYMSRTTAVLFVLTGWTSISRMKRPDPGYSRCDRRQARRSADPSVGPTRRQVRFRVPRSGSDAPGPKAIEPAGFCVLTLRGTTYARARRVRRFGANVPNDFSWKAFLRRRSPSGVAWMKPPHLFLTLSARVKPTRRSIAVAERTSSPPAEKSAPPPSSPIGSPPAAYLLAAYSAWATACSRSVNAQRASASRQKDTSS